MKIKFLSELALETLRVNLKHHLHLFRKDDNKALLAALKADIGEDPLKESNYSLPDSMVLNPSTSGEEEVANIRKIYGELKTLPRSIACDGRLWAGLAIDRFWKYTKDRWEFGTSFSEGKVLDHFLFKGHSKKVYTRQSIARLWWIGDLTYDPSRADPYEITSFTMKDTDYVVNLLERGFSSNRQIFREVIEAIEQGRAENLVIARQEIREISKYLNLLGGVYVLDAFPEGLVREKVYAMAKKLNGVQ